MDMERIREDLGQTWRWLADGWRSLSRKAANALTYFSPDKPETGAPGQWGLMAVDVSDRTDRMILELEAPGLDRDEIEVTVEVDRVIVTGTRSYSADRTEGAMHISERAFGRFQRVIPLPEKGATDGASAVYKRGVLTIEVPKAAPPQRHKIRIGSN